MKIGIPADKAPPAAVTNGHASANGVAHASNARKVPAPASAATDAASATLALSSTASTLMSSAANPEFDAAKVERIARSIADGSFTVNPEAIADKLIANAQELLTKVRP